MRSREGNLDFEEVDAERVAQARVDAQDVSHLRLEVRDQILRHLALRIIEVFIERNAQRHRQQELLLACATNTGLKFEYFIG